MTLPSPPALIPQQPWQWAGYLSLANQGLPCSGMTIDPSLFKQWSFQEISVTDSRERSLSHGANMLKGIGLETSADISPSYQIVRRNEATLQRVSQTSENEAWMERVMESIIWVSRISAGINIRLRVKCLGLNLTLMEFNKCLHAKNCYLFVWGRLQLDWL